MRFRYVLYWVFLCCLSPISVWGWAGSRCDSLFDAADGLLNSRGDLKRAASLYREAGFCLYDVGNYGDAIVGWSEYFKCLTVVGDYTGFEDVIHRVKQNDSLKVFEYYPLLCKNIGQYYVYMGEYETAFGEYAACEAMLNGNGAADTMMLGMLYGELGYLYRLVGESDWSLQYYRKSLSFFESQPNSVETVRTWNNIGRALGAKGEFGAARDMYLKALPVAERSLKLSLYTNLSNVYIDLGKPDSSLYYGRAALDWQVGEQDVSKIGRTKKHIGEALLRLKRYEEAIGVLKESYTERLRVNDRAGLPVTARLLSEAYWAVGSRAQSVFWIEESIQNTTWAFNSAGAVGIRSIVLQLDAFDAYVQKIRYLDDFYKRTGHHAWLLAALAVSKQAEDVIDAIRNQQLTNDSKLLWRQKFREFYPLVLSLCIEAGYSGQAFYFLEKSKSLLLLEQYFLENNYSAMLNERELTEFNALRKNLAKAQVLKDPKPMWMDSVVIFQQRLQDWQQGISHKYPRIHTYGEPITLKSALSKVGREQCILEYFQDTDSSFWVFKLERNKLSQIHLKTPQIDSLIEALNHPIQTNEDKISAFNAPLAHHLYNILVRPLHIESEHVILSPDGSLSNLPFELLLTRPAPANQGTDNYFQTCSFFIEQCAISYTPSVSLFFFDVKKKKPTRTQLSIAPIFPNSRWYLPASGREVDSIARIMGGDKVIGNEATTHQILPHIKDYQNIHLATHTSPASNTRPSAILFADTSLYLPEIQSLNLNTQLMVLSVCQAIKGIRTAGEGNISIARSLHAAGVQSVIASTWEIDDQAAQYFFEIFYKHLKQVKQPYKALQITKIQLIQGSYRRYSTPYFWAGFIGIGRINA
jgi:CHAT domain-containing protein